MDITNQMGIIEPARSGIASSPLYLSVSFVQFSVVQRAFTFHSSTDMTACYEANRKWPLRYQDSEASQTSIYWLSHQDLKLAKHKIR